MSNTSALRQKPENRVICNICPAPGSASAQLTVDRQHPFFFDHPHDHIPGLLLLEGGHQLALEMLPGGQWFARSLDASFNKYCLFDEAVVLDGRCTTQDEGWVCEITISQHQDVRAGLRWEFLPLPALLLSQLPVNAGPPVAKAQVNKVRDENVMIEEPSVSSQGKIECHALTPHPDNWLADSNSQTHPLYLLEAFMQLQRSLNHAESVRLRDILLGVSIRQTQPLQPGSRFLMSSDTGQDKDAGRHFSRGADLWAAGQCFARCEMHSGRIRRARNKRELKEEGV